MSGKRSFVIVGLVLCASLFLPGFETAAQDRYPNRPIEVILPFTPGGPLDLGTRFFADKWAEFLGQPVVVVNKGGASGALASKFVANSRPDGYTLLATSDSPMINARIERKEAGYDLNSFRFLFNWGKVVVFFTVKSDSRWKTMQDLIKEAKSHPGKLKYATWGPNSATVMAMELFSKAAGIKLTFVPFKATPDSLTAVAGGNADLAVTNGLAGMAGTGMLRALAVTDEERLFDYPDVPTLKEVGYPIRYFNNPSGLAAPAKTPDSVIAKITEAHQKARTKYDKEIRDKLYKTGQYPMYADGKTCMEQLKEREQLFRDFYAQIGFKPE